MLIRYAVTVLLIALMVKTAWAESSLQEFELDGVAATVGDKPITLSDIARRIGLDEPLTFRTASVDPQARQALEHLIHERLIAAEAAARGLSASEKEVDEYLAAVREQNQINEAQMIDALGARGLTLPEYREQVQLDIIKSKITSAEMKEGAAVRDAEIRRYIKEHPELTSEGRILKLRRISIDTQSRLIESARELAEMILQKVGDGADFAELARLHSDGPEAREGGLIGIVAERDLNTRILHAVENLTQGAASRIVESEEQLEIFFIERSFSSQTHDHSTDLEDEIRELLRRSKIEAKMGSFFAEELYQRHPVERKL